MKKNQTAVCIAAFGMLVVASTCFSLSHNRRLGAPTLLFGSAGDRWKDVFQQLNDSNTGPLISEDSLNSVNCVSTPNPDSRERILCLWFDFVNCETGQPLPHQSLEQVFNFSAKNGKIVNIKRLSDDCPGAVVLRVQSDSSTPTQDVQVSLTPKGGDFCAIRVVQSALRYRTQRLSGGFVNGRDWNQFGTCSDPEFVAEIYLPLDLEAMHFPAEGNSVWNFYIESYDRDGDRTRTIDMKETMKQLNDPTKTELTVEKTWKGLKDAADASTYTSFYPAREKFGPLPYYYDLESE